MEPVVVEGSAVESVALSSAAPIATAAALNPAAASRVADRVRPEAEQDRTNPAVPGPRVAA